MKKKKGMSFQELMNRKERYDELCEADELLYHFYINYDEMHEVRKVIENIIEKEHQVLFNEFKKYL